MHSICNAKPASMHLVTGHSLTYMFHDTQSTAPDDPAARFNLELLACVRAAWGEAFRTLLDVGAANLYALVPPTAAMLAAAPASPGCVLAQQVVFTLQHHCKMHLLPSLHNICCSDGVLLSRPSSNILPGPCVRLGWLLACRCARTLRLGRCGACAAAAWWAQQMQHSYRQVNLISLTCHH
jgi:hypothetical protein